jgi:AcrR family transcriptional regulator
MADKIGSVVRRPRGRPKTENPTTAATFQRAALDLFSKKNYAAVTIKDIADATGMTASLLYYYFDDKDRLFLTVLEATIDRVFELCDDISNSEMEPLAVLTNWLQHHIDNYGLIQQLIKIMMDYSNTHLRSPQINKAIAHFYNTEAQIVHSAIKRGMKSGVFRKVDPAEITTLIATFLDGVLVRPIIRPNFKPKPAIVQFHSFLMQHLLSGKSPRRSLQLRITPPRRDG